MMKIFYATCLLAAAVVYTASAADIPDGFPQFIVPGHEKEMQSIRALFWHHFEGAGPLIPLSTLWPAISPEKVRDMRARWASTLLSRPMDAEGYVLTLQHDGTAHAEGWPFPLWSQAGGMGWHFRGTGISGYDAPLVKPDDWKILGCKSNAVNDKGWVVTLTEPHANIQTPACSFPVRAAPWLRLNWWCDGLAGANCFVEWTTSDQPDFSPDRRAYFSPAHDSNNPGETRTMIPMYRLANWK